MVVERDATALRTLASNHILALCGYLVGVEAVLAIDLK